MRDYVKIDEYVEYDVNSGQLWISQSDKSILGLLWDLLFIKSRIRKINNKIQELHELHENNG